MTLNAHAIEISEASAQAEVSFFAGIDSERRITMSMVLSDNTDLVVYKRRVDGEPPLWGLYVWRPWDERMRPIKDCGLAERLIFVELWRALRGEYLAEIERLEEIVAKRWP